MKELLKKRPDLPSYKEFCIEGEKVHPEDVGLVPHSNNRVCRRIGNMVAAIGRWSSEVYQVSDEGPVKIHDTWSYEQ